MKVGILTDYPSIAVQSGPALHTKFLHDGLVARNHDVTLMGPDTLDGQTPTAGAKLFLLKGHPYPSHPKVKVVVPSPLRKMLAPPVFDVIHGQVNNHVIEYANWMRKMHRTAVLNTNIIHLPTHSHFILSDRLYANPLAREIAKQSAYSVERDLARMYNEGDCMIVQSRYMVDYWRSRGVTVPIEVVGRPIDPAKFSATPGQDPYPTHFAKGRRLVVVCRHDREKNLEYLLDVFDRHIAANDPAATLTLIGHGHAHLALQQHAARGRHGDRVFFPGEISHAGLVDWYAHADLFVYTSLSETFGNVVNEALWCGLPVVALNDSMGVAHQVLDTVNGFLVEPNQVDSASRFARAVAVVLDNARLRETLGRNAALHARRNAAPEVVLDRFERIYEAAIRRAHDEVKVPLSTRSTTVQRLSFAKHIATWARYNYLLLAIGNASFRMGMSRDRVEGGLDLDARPVTSTLSVVDAAE